MTAIGEQGGPTEMGNEQQRQSAGTGAVDVQTTAVETTRTIETTTPAAAESVGTDLGKVRELVLKAHPDVVPDLVRGGSVDELIASVEPARTAYQRIVDQVRGGGETTVMADAGSTDNAGGETTVVVQPPAVPAGGASNVAEPTELAPTTRIAQALATRKKRG